MDRFAQIIVAAARQAEADAGRGHRRGAGPGRRVDRDRNRRAQVVPGLLRHAARSAGPIAVNPFAIPCIIPNMGAGWVSMELGTRGPLSSECTACAASNMAIGQGVDDIRLGRADVMLCGGTESAINQVGIAGFGAMRALSRRNDDPARASRPFDAGARRLRDG